MMLDLPIYATLDALLYFKLFSHSRDQAQTYDQNEVCTAALYLSSKVNEFDKARLRDILNMVKFAIYLE